MVEHEHKGLYCVECDKEIGMNPYEIRTHNETHDSTNPHCLLCITKCGEGHPIEGHLVMIPGFDGYYYVSYAGWADQWLVKDEVHVDTARASLEEVKAQLVHSGDDSLCGKCGVEVTDSEGRCNQCGIGYSLAEIDEHESEIPG